MHRPVISLRDRIAQNKYFHFEIIQIGTGGNGGYLLQRLSKLLYSLSQQNELFSYRYVIVDGDQVEPKNVYRQPFIEQDIGLPKVEVLANRYSNAYGIPIHYRASYIEQVKELQDLFSYHRSHFYVDIPVLLGCVDNNATRQIMHQLFEKMSTIVYIDSGIDSVNPEEIPSVQRKMGYSGQVVCGFKWYSQLILEPVGMVYPDILEDTDSRLPTQACGEQVLYYPQRMQTNETAALVMMSYLNMLLSESMIMSHYVNFNAQTMLMRPMYIEEQQMMRWSSDEKQAKAV